MKDSIGTTFYKGKADGEYPAIRNWFFNKPMAFLQDMYLDQKKYKKDKN